MSKYAEALAQLLVCIYDVCWLKSSLVQVFMYHCVEKYVFYVYKDPQKKMYNKIVVEC